MRRTGWAWFAVSVALGIGAEATAVDTQIDVRALSKGAKFIGTGVAGAEITIRDAETHELLARGKTVGNSGNDSRIMAEAWPRHAPLSTTTSAVFRATLDLEEPRQVVVTARGPLSQPQSTAVGEIKLSYAGEIGQFAGVFPIPGPGPYDITVYAFDIGNGNTGLDRATIVVAEAAAAADED